jgi:hypothetical protein
VAPLQPNWILLICHVAVVLEKPAHTNAVMAFALAPENELSGTVMVCVLPVRPLTPKYCEVKAEAEQDVFV